MKPEDKLRADIEKLRADKDELLTFLERVAGWATGPVRSACNTLLASHARSPVPLHKPMVLAAEVLPPRGAAVSRAADTLT